METNLNQEDLDIDSNTDTTVPAEDTDAPAIETVQAENTDAPAIDTMPAEDTDAPAIETMPAEDIDAPAIYTEVDEAQANQEETNYFASSIRYIELLKDANANIELLKDANAPYITLENVTNFESQNAIATPLGDATFVSEHPLEELMMQEVETLTGDFFTKDQSLNSDENNGIILDRYTAYPAEPIAEADIQQEDQATVNNTAIESTQQEDTFRSEVIQALLAASHTEMDTSLPADTDYEQPADTADLIDNQQPDGFTDASDNQQDSYTTDEDKPSQPEVSHPKKGEYTYYGLTDAQIVLGVSFAAVTILLLEVVYECFPGNHITQTE